MDPYEPHLDGSIPDSASELPEPAEPPGPAEPAEPAEPLVPSGKLPPDPDVPPAATGLKALRVDPAHRPGWVRGTDRTPAVGEPVYCVGGEGAVAALHGRTGDGSRLVEIQLGNEKTPFYAAASNILLLAD